jgi:hypothetical protein
MKNKRVLFLCGLLKNEGALIILEVKSYEEADSYILQDPLIINNCYGEYIIYELIEANDDNNWLMGSN